MSSGCDRVSGVAGVRVTGKTKPIQVKRSTVRDSQAARSDKSEANGDTFARLAPPDSSGRQY